MRLDSKRLISSTEARKTLAALLDAAQDQHITHILRENTVVAHLVPADARVITAEIEPNLRHLVARAAAEHFAADPEHGHREIARVLAWAWGCQDAAAVTWFGAYADAVATQQDERHISRPTLDELWQAVATALREFMPTGPISDFGSAIRTAVDQPLDGYTADGGQADLRGVHGD